MMRFRVVFAAAMVLLIATGVAFSQSGPVPVTEPPVVVGGVSGSGPAPSGQQQAHAPAGYIQQTVTVAGETRTYYVRDPRYRQLAGKLDQETENRKHEDEKTRSYIRDEREARRNADDDLNGRVDAVAGIANSADLKAERALQQQQQTTAATTSQRKGSSTMDILKTIFEAVLALGVIWGVIMFCIWMSRRNNGGCSSSSVDQIALARGAHGINKKSPRRGSSLHISRDAQGRTTGYDEFDYEVT